MADDELSDLQEQLAEARAEVERLQATAADSQAQAAPLSGAERRGAPATRRGPVGAGDRTGAARRAERRAFDGASRAVRRPGRDPGASRPPPGRRREVPRGAPGGGPRATGGPGRRRVNRGGGGVGRAGAADGTPGPRAAGVAGAGGTRAHGLASARRARSLGPQPGGEDPPRPQPEAVVGMHRASVTIRTEEGSSSPVE